jgi:hypothetical protein
MPDDSATCPEHGLPLTELADHSLPSRVWLCPSCAAQWSERDRERLGRNALVVMQALMAASLSGAR